MKAKETFEKLGYKQEIGKNYIEYKLIEKYGKSYYEYQIEYYILFDLEKESISIGTSSGVYVHNFDIRVLQAILQQVKELKWKKKNLVK